MIQESGRDAEKLVRELERAIAAGDATSALDVLRRFQKAAGGDPNVLTLADVQFRIAVQKDTDRAAALFTSAYLESRLAELLRTYFVADEETADAILSGSGALGTLSSRIELAFLLGLMSRPERRDFNLIRKIRNEFAHHPEPIDFSHASVESRCRELGAPYADKPRTRFIQSALRLVGNISSAIYRMNEGTLPRCQECPQPAPPAPAAKRILDSRMQQRRGQPKSD